MQMPTAASSPAPRKVAAGRATGWLGEAYGLFRQKPGVWIGILVIWVLLSAVINAVPGLNLVGSFLGPIFVAGIMLGCASLARGAGLRVEHLFAGFQSGRVGALLMQTVWTLLIGVAGAIALALVFLLPSLDALRALEHPSFPDIILALGLGRVVIFGLAVATLGVLIAMATWFAAPLIVFRGLPALEAMKLSFRACTTNWLVLTVYGLLLAAMLVVACIPLGLGLLIALPVLMASVYTSYCDIFGAPAP